MSMQQVGTALRVRATHCDAVSIYSVAQQGLTGPWRCLFDPDAGRKQQTSKHHVEADPQRLLAPAVATAVENRDEALIPKPSPVAALCLPPRPAWPAKAPPGRLRGT